MMTRRTAFNILSRLALEPTADSQEKLHRIEAVETIAHALGYRAEEVAAHAHADALVEADRTQLRFVALLGTDPEDNGQ